MGSKRDVMGCSWQYRGLFANLHHPFYNVAWKKANIFGIMALYNSKNIKQYIGNIMAYVSVNGRFNGDSSWGLNEFSPANIYLYRDSIGYNQQPNWIILKH